MVCYRLVAVLAVTVASKAEKTQEREQFVGCPEVVCNTGGDRSGLAKAALSSVKPCTTKHSPHLEMPV